MSGNFDVEAVAVAASKTSMFTHGSHLSVSWGHRSNGKTRALQAWDRGSTPRGSTNLWNDGTDQSSQNIVEVGRLIEPNRSSI